jgi:hypothetical protein
VQQSTELAAIKSTDAAWADRCDWAWLVPLVARSLCGDETPFACSRAWDMPPPCPHQAFISCETPLTRLSHCSPQVHVSFWIKFGLILLCLPDVLPQCLLACLLRALRRHSLSLTNTNTRIPEQSLSIPLQRRVKTACATERRTFD